MMGPLAASKAVGVGSTEAQGGSGAGRLSFVATKGSEADGAQAATDGGGSLRDGNDSSGSQLSVPEPLPGTGGSGDFKRGKRIRRMLKVAGPESLVLDCQCILIKPNLSSDPHRI